MLSREEEGRRRSERTDEIESSIKPAPKGGVVEGERKRQQLCVEERKKGCDLRVGTTYRKVEQFLKSLQDKYFNC